MNAADSDGRRADCDVIVVGYGPVGATLAHLLGLQGIDTVVLERWSGAFPLPRAVHFDDEAMRLFQTIGVAETLKDDVVVNKGMRFVGPEGELLVDWPRPQEVGPRGWHASYRFHQPDLEALLRRTLAERPTVRVLPGVEAVACDMDREGVTLTLRNFPGEGVEEEPGAPRFPLRARYVVGCDGARSVVREWIGGGVEDLGCDQDWLVVDLLARRPLPHLSDWTIQTCDPRRPTTIARGPGMRRRWEFMVMPGEDSADMVRPETVWALLGPWITPQDADIERSAVYRFHALLAERWRRERLLIAGDAAHQTPPFLGQGLCAGLRDAANLGWKLGMALSGRADDSLLDSYQIERAPHARAFLMEAIRLGGILQATDADDVARNRGMAQHPEVMRSLAPLIGPGLHGGAPAPAGAPFAQPVLADGRRFDDVVGLRFALYATGAFAARLSDDDRRALEALDAPVLTAAEGDEALAALGAPAVLVRPDRVVLGVAKTPADLRRLIDRLPMAAAAALSLH